jgi:hypothetical protein
VRDAAGPVRSEARERFTTDVQPVVTSALAALDSATEDARSEAVKRGRALATSLKGEVAPPPKRHRARTALIVAGLGGAAFAVARRLTGHRQTTTEWQSSYTPPAPMTPATPATDVGAHRAEGPTDVAAADPAEAASDAVETPHTPTTPDHPVAEIDIEPTEKD